MWREPQNKEQGILNAEVKRGNSYLMLKVKAYGVLKKFAIEKSNAGLLR